MTKMRPSFSVAALLFLLLILWAANAYCPAQQVGTQEKMEISPEKKEPDKIAAGPQDVRERTGVWVFFIWIWISIIVLVYFLWLKIREVDRLCRIRFFSSDKG